MAAEFSEDYVKNMISKLSPHVGIVLKSFIGAKVKMMAGIVVLSICLLIFCSAFLAFVLHAEQCFLNNCGSNGVTAAPVPPGYQGIILNENDRNFVEIMKALSGIGIAISSIVVLLAMIVLYAMWKVASGG